VFRIMLRQYAPNDGHVPDFLANAILEKFEIRAGQTRDRITLAVTDDNIEDDGRRSTSKLRPSFQRDRPAKQPRCEETKKNRD
jgi:hypothetical protein